MNFKNKIILQHFLLKTLFGRKYHQLINKYEFPHYFYASKRHLIKYGIHFGRLLVCVLLIT